MRTTSAPFSQDFRPLISWVAIAAFWALLPSLVSAADFSEWQWKQEFPVPSPGLLKLVVPVETLNAARSDLGDLRLLDPSGAEVAYVSEEPSPGGKEMRAPRTFQVSLENGSTLVTLETGSSLPLESVELSTPAMAFIKSVQIEGSTDKEHWQILSKGLPLFRQNGVSQLQLPISGSWPWLRLTINDQRSEAIAITGATLHFGQVFFGTTEPLTVNVVERVENPGQTRLVLDLGAANIDVVSVRFATEERLFTRRITTCIRQVTENTILEQPIAQGVVYRVNLDGEARSENLVLPIGRTVPSRELILLLQNDDSPPLQVASVSALRRPVHLVFDARQAGSFVLMTGNRNAAPPRYDLGQLRANFRNIPVSAIRPGPAALNPSYRPAEALPEIQEVGTTLDTAGWRFRKPVQLSASGVQQLELDPGVLVRAQPGFGDLRLVRDGRQLPFILEHPSITRSVQPVVVVTNSTTLPHVSKWRLTLPERGLPAVRMFCETRDPLFKRDFRLYEIVTDARGREYESALASATWIQTSSRNSKQFVFELSSPPTTDMLYLETDDGDNLPISLTRFELVYPVTRLLFKTTSTAPLHLYYGNRDSLSPRYDLSLVAPQLLAVTKHDARLGPQEHLKKASWSEEAHPGSGGVLFWGILAVVVIALVFTISRLLPRQPQP